MAQVWRRRPAVAVDGYPISRFRFKNKDLLFRAKAFVTSTEANRRGAALLLPPRRSVLDDPELQRKYRSWRAASLTIPAAITVLQLPEFSELIDMLALRIQQALAGSADAKQTLDQAAEELRRLLRERGYYK